MYKLCLDKPENFECDISVKNASLKNSMARLVVESPNGINFIFEGKIQGEKCVIPIRRLKGLLEENCTGKMHLEVVVEDTFFKPWQSDYLVEEHTSVKVSINESKQPSKPSVAVKVPQSKIEENQWLPVYEVSKLCEAFGITRKTFSARSSDFKQILKEYFKANPTFSGRKSQIIYALGKLLK